MKIMDLINELNNVAETYGDIEVQIQDDGKGKTGMIVGHESFFVVPELYDDPNNEKGETLCNLRWWPA